MIYFNPTHKPVTLPSQATMPTDLRRRRRPPTVDIIAAFMAINGADLPRTSAHMLDNGICRVVANTHRFTIGRDPLTAFLGKPEYTLWFESATRVACTGNIDSVLNYLTQCATQTRS
jgi:hypothetical protein